MKLSELALCTALLTAALSGCATEEAPSYTQETIISTEAVTVTEPIPAAPATIMLDGKEFTLPSEEFINEAVSGNTANYNILYYPDGSYKACTYDELQEILMADTAAEMITEEYYNAHAKDFYETYEDYKTSMQLFYGFDDSSMPVPSNHSIVISITCNNSESPDDCGKTAFNYFIKKLSENAYPDFSKAAAAEEKLTVNIYAQEQEGRLCLGAWYLKDGEYGTSDLFKDTYISADGTELVSVGGLVLSDTRSLYITAEKDAENAEGWSGVSPEGYDSVVYSCFDDIDISALAQKFPRLERLFMDVYSVQCLNPQGFADFECLSELDFEYPDSCEDSGWIADIKAEKLTIRSISDSVDALSQCKADTIIIECSTDDWVLDSISCCENIDELTLRSRFVPDNPDFSRMTGIKNLKKLTLDITKDDEPLDLSAFRDADFFEELEIIADREITADVLPTIKGLRSLTLKNVQNTDYSFFKDMTSLERVTLDDCRSSYIDFTDIYNLPDITELHFKSVSADLKGIENASKLHTLSINGSYSNLSSIKDCPNLKNLIIEGVKGSSFDAESIEKFTQLEKLRLKDVETHHYESLKKLKGLKQLELIGAGLSESHVDTLREALPDCEITAERTVNSAEALRAEPETSEMYSDIRVESYKIRDDYWSKNYVVKNTGTDTVPNTLEFLAENGFLEGSSDMMISYSYEDSTVQERIKITDGTPDYDTSEVYLSVLSTLDPDTLAGYEFRQLDPNETVNIYLSDKE